MNEPNTELLPATVQSGAVARPQPTVADMLQAVIQGGVTEKNVAAMEQLVRLYEHMEERNAEKAFAAAFVELQAETPTVQATKVVPNNDGTPRYRFAPFEDLMAQVGPMLQRHGFAVSFTSEVKEGRIVQTCTLQHIGGHQRSSSFAVRVGKGPPGSSESQADGAASTYAKRFALTDALNIVIGHLDNDARLEGGTITSEQALELSKRVLATKSDVAKFLAFAGAKTFEEIAAAKYSILDENLRKREKQQKPATTPAPTQ